MCAKVGFHGLITAIRNGGYRRVSPVAPRPREGPLTEPIAGAQFRPKERVLMPLSDTRRGHQKRVGGRFLPFSQSARAVFRTEVWPSLRRRDCSHDFVAPEQVAMLGNSNGWLCGVKNLTLDTPPGADLWD